jgi:hypothetical protein
VWPPRAVSDGASNPQLHSTPRVTSGTLAAHISHTVRLVGERLGDGSSGRVAVRTADGDAQVVLPPGGAGLLPRGRFVEVIGAVQPDLSVAMSRAGDLGDSFNMDNYTEVIRLIPAKAPGVFGW